MFPMSCLLVQISGLGFVDPIRVGPSFSDRLITDHNVEKIEIFFWLTTVEKFYYSHVWEDGMGLLVIKWDSEKTLTHCLKVFSLMK